MVYFLRLLLLLGVTFFLPFIVHAKVYTGFIDKLPITLELEANNHNTYSGRYFYHRYYKDIPLSGEKKGQKILLIEGYYYEHADLEPKFELTEVSAQTIKGIWVNPKNGQSKTVELQLVELSPNDPVDKPHLADLAKSSYFDYLRLRALKLESLEQQEFMGYTLQWFKEPHSHIRSFSIKTPSTPGNWSKINAILESQFWFSVSEGLQCGIYEGNEQDIRPIFLSPNIVSILSSGSVFCGGAHPNFFQTGINLDVHTGRPLSLEEVIGWRGSNKNLPVWLMQTMQRLYTKKMQDEDCDYLQEEAWQLEGASWVVTPKGVKLYPYFPYVAKACTYIDWAVLPTKEFPK